jgi:hypothetical protein
MWGFAKQVSYKNIIGIENISMFKLVNI